jgi:hypothetical protein
VERRSAPSKSATLARLQGSIKLSSCFGTQICPVKKRYVGEAPKGPSVSLSSNFDPVTLDRQASPL